MMKVYRAVMCLRTHSTEMNYFFDWVTSEGIHINMVYNKWKGNLTRILWKIEALLSHHFINTEIYILLCKDEWRGWDLLCHPAFLKESILLKTTKMQSIKCKRKWHCWVWTVLSQKQEHIRTSNSTFISRCPSYEIA